jgi:chromosome segregation ATPase
MKREMNELRTKIDNIKKEVTHNMENLRKNNEQKYKTKWKANPAEQNKQNTESQNSKMKWELKEKTEELLVKQLKTCEKKMQELTESIKRPNLRIMGIKEGEEVQAKGMCNIFNKIITENFPNLEKTMPIHVQEASRTPNRLD